MEKVVSLKNAVAGTSGHKVSMRLIYAEDVREPDFQAASDAWVSLEKIGIDPGDLIVERLGNEVHGYSVKTLDLGERLIDAQNSIGESVVGEDRLVSYRLVQVEGQNKYLPVGEAPSNILPFPGQLIRHEPFSLVSQTENKGQNVIQMAAVLKRKQTVIAEPAESEKIEAQGMENYVRDDEFMGRSIVQYLPGLTAKKAA